MLLYLFWFVASVVVLFGTLSKDKKTQTQWMMFFMLALGLFIGLADMLGGYDRYIYAELFDSMADVTRAGGNPWRSYAYGFFRGEFGYGSLSALLSFLTSNRYIYILILTLIIYVLLFLSLKEYAENAPFAIVMFMGLWMFFTFTYLRQVLGCSIAWLSIRYILKRDFKRFLLVWFIAFSFHHSAVVFFPMYFVPIKKYSKNRVIILMIAAFLIGLTSIPQNLFETYGEIETERVSGETYAMDAGFRFAYLLEAGFFLFVILYNYKLISRNRRDVVLLNMALVFCAILLVFIRSENGGRLGWYYMLGVFCTLSNICVQKKNITVQGAGLIVVSLLLYSRIYIAWQNNMMGLYPYKTFLTDGSRKNDPIREKYEYDDRYEIDKFYRPALWFMKE